MARKVDLKDFVRGSVDVPMSERIKSEFAYAPEFAKRVIELAHYISSVGLSLEESLQLSGIRKDRWNELTKRYPVLVELVELKELEYKNSLLSTLSKHQEKDEKIALWLLERRYPKEFSTRKGASNSGDINIVTQAVQFVQKHGDHNPLVDTGNNVSVVQHEEGETKKLEAKLKDLLDTPKLQ